MKTAAIVGGGVIGGGWAARFLLNGWDVRVFDPDPEAERKINEVLANARHSFPSLRDGPMPAGGELSFHDDLADAVRDVDWVQESVPERLKLKLNVYADIQEANDSVMIGSSTSGFKPSELAEGAISPDRIVVTHPFNPVYLLPLVELVPAPEVTGEGIAEAKAVIEEIGMYPLLVRKEIDAHIADRLLEAVWREALWLINDGIATTEEIDNAIRYGFGIRWAQMGLFETYRVAGGEAGMKHFIGQFGPALKWPWTKLMDVPELTDDLVDTIADQSDEQSGMYSIRQLERIRDENLVGMMRALKANNFGAGVLLNNSDTPVAPKLDGSDWVMTADRTVPLDWVDYNGHMNDAAYLKAFSEASDVLLDLIGAGADYVAAGHSFFTLESHLKYLEEIKSGAPFKIFAYVVQGSGKKLHILQEMRKPDGKVIAWNEQMILHVNMETRATCPMLPQVAERAGKLEAGHAKLPKPEALGGSIRQPS
ncbi:MAG: carnitine 3-dehydrogenase [Pseudomonadota bacterium]